MADRRPAYRGEIIEQVLRFSARRRLLPKLLRERSLVEGVWNGRKGWLAIGAVVWTVHGFSKARHREESVLLREVLKPGEHVIIRQAITRPTRRQLRRAGKITAASTRG
jgi:hypothetical protein